MLVEILSGIPSDANAELVLVGLFLFCVGAALYVWRAGKSG